MSVIRIKFVFIKDILKVNIYIRNCGLKQFGHQLLRELNGFILKPDIELCAAVCGFIDA